MNKLFTAGYSGHTPNQLKQAAESLNAIVVDIRYFPRSRIAGWNGGELRELLGARYFLLPAWGNVNYKSGPIQLSDAARGLVRVLGILENHSVILLCGCAEYSDCHRRVCAELFHERGTPTQELEWPASPVAVGKVRCISLWQPWSWLCVTTDDQGRAEKENETRSWSTPYRGPLLIHAAKKWDHDNADMSDDPWFRGVIGRHFSEPIQIKELGFGGIIGCVDLVECKATGDWCKELSAQERAFGNFAPGRFAWKFANARRFPQMIPLRGQQGMWDVEIDLDAALRSEVEAVAPLPTKPSKERSVTPQQNLF